MRGGIQAREGHNTVRPTSSRTMGARVCTLGTSCGDNARGWNPLRDAFKNEARVNKDSNTSHAPEKSLSLCRGDKIAILHHIQCSSDLQSDAELLCISPLLLFPLTGRHRGPTPTLARDHTADSCTDANLCDLGRVCRYRGALNNTLRLVVFHVVKMV